MEQSSGDMSEQIEILTVAVLVLAGKEVLSRKLLEIELQEILDDLAVIKEASEAATWMPLMQENTPSLAERAKELDLVITDVERKHGAHSGTVVALDRRAILIKIASKMAVLLPFSALTTGQIRPQLGDNVWMQYRDWELITTVQASAGTIRRGEEK